MIDNAMPNLSNFFPVTELAVLAQSGGDQSWAFLGEDSMAWIVLALGAAMVVGNVLAIVKPPANQTTKAPVGRTIVMISIGAIAALWGLASLFS